MVIALAGFVTAGALPAAAAPGTVWYVALGDSYAAGQGAPPYVNDCKQSAKGYPALLDAKGNIRLVANETCTGATTEKVTDQLSVLNPGRTKLVTLTVGANDLNVSGLATLCTTPGMVDQCLAAIELARGNLQGLGSKLTNLYGDVADAAPKALIVVTGYPHLVESTAPFPPFDPGVIAALNTATDELNSTIQNAVDDADHAVDPTRDNIVYVDVTDAFKDHGIGGTLSPSFINAPPNADAFHPTAAGYRAYADAISAVLRAAGLLDEQAQLG